jgi:hypothetical protein
MFLKRGRLQCPRAHAAGPSVSSVSIGSGSDDVAMRDTISPGHCSDGRVLRLERRAEVDIDRGKLDTELLSV